MAIYVGNGAVVTVKGGSLTSLRQGMYVGSDAEVRLENVNVKGRTDGVYVGSSAKVTAVGGVIEGKTRAFYVSSNAKITLWETKTLAKLYKRCGATVSRRKLDKVPKPNSRPLDLPTPK